MDSFFAQSEFVHEDLTVTTKEATTVVLFSCVNTADAGEAGSSGGLTCCCINSDRP